MVGSQQEEGMQYLKNLLNWRKNSEVIHKGKLKQFVTQDGIYVYFRYDEKDAIMVVINKNKEAKILDLIRFQEVLKDYKEAKDVVSGTKFIFANDLTVPAETVMVLELD